MYSLCKQLLRKPIPTGIAVGDTGISKSVEELPVASTLLCFRGSLEISSSLIGCQKYPLLFSFALVPVLINPSHSVYTLRYKVRFGKYLTSRYFNIQTWNMAALDMNCIPLGRGGQRKC
ncbi:hypothetical protein GDO78_002092 [Eleutherodactylus coqui]|uniref:Uncharacterized protein n=1 Tax=Eleutherodactylus coqui TaxID=57060 RepID=A0A8J6FV01_ELECQ|nr:hypothetical protein GDO78_002092 [Eleutherodactylus coqui]